MVEERLGSPQACRGTFYSHLSFTCRLHEHNVSETRKKMLINMTINNVKVGNRRNGRMNAVKETRLE